MGSSKNVNVNGKVGNLVFYEYRGKGCVRRAPGSIRHTKGMEKSASQFGFASTISAYLRAQIENFLPDPKDKPMLYAFNSAIHKWLRMQQPMADTFSTSNFYIDQFQFNQQAPLPILVKSPIVAQLSGTGGIEIDIPALMPGVDIIAPAGTINVHWSARVVSTQLFFNSNTCRAFGRSTDEIRDAGVTMPYNDEPMPAHRLTLSLGPEATVLTIVIVRLQYEVIRYGEAVLVTDKQWTPAAIAGSCFGVPGAD